MRTLNAGSATPLSLAPPSDAELLARCRTGDEDAWHQLVGRYERLVYSVALRNGLDDDEAGEVTQIVFVALIDALHALEDESKLASWLMTVARRQAWRLRSVQRRTVSLDEMAEPSVDPYPDWDSLVVVQDALSVLGGTCRELLLALYFDADEPSYAEIAHRMGRSIGGIGPMRGRCLERLRAILSEESA